MKRPSRDSASETLYAGSLRSSVTIKPMSLDDYKVVLYWNVPCGWVAEVPSIPGCYALMLTRESALTELAAVFQMILDE